MGHVVQKKDESYLYPTTSSIELHWPYLDPECGHITLLKLASEMALAKSRLSGTTVSDDNDFRTRNPVEGRK